MNLKIEVETKAISASWSRELINDLKSFHGMDYDAFEKQIENELRRESRKRKIEKILNS
jgi:hypothetical protein